MQDCGISSVLALKISQSYTEPSVSYTEPSVYGLNNLHDCLYPEISDGQILHHMTPLGFTELTYSHW